MSPPLGRAARVCPKCGRPLPWSVPVPGERAVWVQLACEVCGWSDASLILEDEWNENTEAIRSSAGMR